MKKKIENLPNKHEVILFKKFDGLKYYLLTPTRCDQIQKNI